MVNILTNPEQITTICEQYLAGASGAEIAKQHEVSRQTIYRLLDSRNVPRRSAGSKTIYGCDRHFFDHIDTEEKAYTLGFIAADGCVSRDALHINLADRDYEHLLRLRAALKSDHPIRPIALGTAAYSGANSCSGLYISSARLLRGLGSQGIRPRKTHGLQWPANLPHSMLRHYLRGYVDGDGGFYVHRRGGLVFSFISTQHFCEGARDYLVSAARVQSIQLHTPKQSTCTRVLDYRGNKQAGRIYHLLYDGATIWLPRKKDKVAEHVKYAIDKPPLLGLRQARDEASLFRHELGAIARVCPKDITAMEEHDKGASPRVVDKLANALGVASSALYQS